MRLFALSVLAALFGLVACDTTSSTIPVFGEPYIVEKNPAPVLEADSLRVTVSYSDCGSTFEVLSSLAGTELWLKHRTSSAACQPYGTRELYLPVDTTGLMPPLRIYLKRARTMDLKIDSTGTAPPETTDPDASP
ncbi:MAG: hypothetical protein Rubg2KO_18850 [Rubricoccaceae bacterium]